MAASPEKRLYTVRNLEAHRERGDAEPSLYEFEVFAEVPFPHECEVGPFAIIPWDAEPTPNGTRRSLILRFADYLEAPDAADKSTKKGFYHGISMPAEFCALASALLRRRVSLGPMLRLDDAPIRIRPPSQRRHPGLIAGEVDTYTLKHRIESLEHLPREFHEAFILSCRMYQEALGLIDDKPDLAYLLLVSSIEVFVAKFCPKTTENDLSADVTSALSACPDAERAVLLRRILDLDFGISRNFVAFIIQHLRDSFWQDSPQIATAAGRIAKEELPDLLKRIYNQRSKTLHEAEPFPPMSCNHRTTNRRLIAVMRLS